MSEYDPRDSDNSSWAAAAYLITLIAVVLFTLYFAG